MALPCSVRDLIPQKSKMGFDQILVKTKIDDGQSTIFVKEDNIFLDDHNQLSNSVLIEFINQLIAAIHGYNVIENNETAKSGLFVGLQDAEFFGTVYLGDTLSLKRFLTEEVAQVNFVQGIINRDGEKIAEFVTKIYEVKDLAELNSLTNLGQTFEGKSDIKLNMNNPPAYLGSTMHRKLYTYLHDSKIGDDFISFKIACPDDFEAFDGHFPGNPILPGVVLLEIANLALELFMKKPVVFKYLKKMKISGMILPNQVITCAIKIDNNNGSTLSFSAILKGKDDREISRFSGNCEGREE